MFKMSHLQIELAAHALDLDVKVEGVPRVRLAEDFQCVVEQDVADADQPSERVQK